MKSRELEAEPCCPTLTFLLPVWSPAKSVKRLCGGEQVPGGIRRKSFHICVSTAACCFPSQKPAYLGWDIQQIKTEDA